MRKRKNTKQRRRIILILKFLCMMVILMILKITFFSSSAISENPSSKDTASLNEKPETDSENEKGSTTLPIKGLSQEGIPTGCESVSTVAALQYFGVNITTDEFIESFLPCKRFYWKNDMLYGPDPQEYFAGDPYQSQSLGCYPAVILKALTKMKRAEYPGMEGLSFHNVSGTDLETLTAQYIDKRIPVILWVTIDMKESYPGMQYHLEDDSLYTWTAQEHCTVLCGYDETSYYLMDPLKGGEIVSRPKELVQKRYQEIGKYALVIIPSDSLS